MPGRHLVDRREDRTPMQAILFAVFMHENRNRRLATPFALTHNS
jgi:hypothetical protein